MYQLGETSKKNLATCDRRLQDIFREVSRKFDIRIIEGHRSQERQEEMYNTGRSQLHFPRSKHNTQPSLAVDVAPGYMDDDGDFVIDWSDMGAFCYMAGYARAVADSMGHKLRWGGDWDSDGQIRDNRFNDLVHFELED